MKYLSILLLLIAVTAKADGKRLIWQDDPAGPTSDGFNIYWDLDIPVGTPLANGPLDVGATVSTDYPGNFEYILLEAGKPFQNVTKYCFEIEGYVKDAQGVQYQGPRAPRVCGVIVNRPLSPVGLQLVD